MLRFINLFKFESRQIAKNGFIYSFTSIVEKSSFLLLIPIYTFYLDPAEFGFVSLVTATAMVIQKLCLSPAGNGLSRMFYKPEYRLDSSSLISSAFWPTLCASISASMIAVGLVDFWLIYPSGFKVTGEVLAAIFVFFALKPVAEFGSSVLRITAKPLIIAKVSLIRVMIVGTVQVSCLSFLNLGLMSMLLGLAIGPAIMICFYFKDIRPFISFELKERLLAAIFSFGLPLLVVSLLSAFLTIFVRQFITAKFSLSELGVYFFAGQLASLMSIIFGGPVKNAFLPFIMKREGDKNDQTNFVRLGSFVMTGVGAIICVAISIFSTELIMVLSTNDAFLSGAQLIPVFSFTLLLFGLSSFFGNGLSMSLKAWQINFVATVRFVTSIIGVYVFWEIGLIGVAIGLCLGQVVGSVLLMLGSSRAYGAKFEYFGICLILMSCASVIYASSILFVEFSWVNVVQKLIGTIGFSIIILSLVLKRVQALKACEDNKVS